VSTARMPLAGGTAQPLLQIGEAPPRGRPIGKRRSMDVLRSRLPARRTTTCFAVLVPFEDRARPDAESPANLRRDRDLALSGEFRVRERHADALPR